MGSAYTPGLRVARRTPFTKERMLPLKGTVNVKVGDKVACEDIVAETALPGDVVSLNVVNRLGVTASDVRNHMLKKEGEAITKGEVIARRKTFFGLFTTEVPAPMTGSVETISDVTGQVLLRHPPKPVQVTAFLDGVVKEVFPEEGVAIETTATFIQGIFGVGRETWGELALATSEPGAVLGEKDLTEAHKDKLVVVGALVSAPLIQRARAIGVKGLIGGGIRDEDLKRLLGYDLGVAITGQENLGITIVVTEGFGQIAIAKRTFDLLKSREGEQTSLSAATQIRAGVMRPEIVIPVTSESDGPADEEGSHSLAPGQAVRCIRQPYFGRLGTVKDLPVELTQVESETWVRVLNVDFGDGKAVTVPRANVELVEG
ncbi:MAG: hypothetical protein ACYS22_12550 [Planctomycetota bacterium]